MILALKILALNKGYHNQLTELIIFLIYFKISHNIFNVACPATIGERPLLPVAIKLKITGLLHLN